MAKKNRNGIKYPKKFMKLMKKKKRIKIRNIPLENEVIEQEHNDASLQF